MDMDADMESDMDTEIQVNGVSIMCIEKFLFHL
jgi:hypothetical protein